MVEDDLRMNEIERADGVTSVWDNETKEGEGNSSIKIFTSIFFLINNKS